MKTLYCGTLLLLTVALLVTGCGGSSIDLDLVGVAGVVKYDDGSFPQGDVQWIRLEPVKEPLGDDSRQFIKAASATISKEDGSFEMYTVRPGDGVIPGKYKVVFLIQKSLEEPESLVAENLTKAETTPLEIDVNTDVEDLEYVIQKP